MFMKADDSLVKAAEQAHSNIAQGRYFEAMREIRRNRISVEHTFRKQVQQGFEAFALGKPLSTAVQGRESDSGSELSLVKKADVEESIAIHNIISKANNNFFHTLYELRQRLAVVNGGKKVDSTNMPSGPSHLCNAYWVASQAFNVDREVKLIIFSLFDQFVMRKAAVVYDAFNKQLFEAGVLPNISSVIRRELKAKRAEEAAQPTDTAQLPESGNADYATPEMDEQTGNTLYQSLFQLLATRRENNPLQPGYLQEPAKAKHWAPITRPDLASAINALQPAASDRIQHLPSGTGQPSENIQIALDEQLLNSIRETLLEEREKLFSDVSEAKQSVDVVDADTIELVGMLFEFMLNYEALPNAAKALISHLHTPLLKVAVLDKEFLIRSSHPARKLLNMLVDAGCRWVNESSLATGIFPHMQETVERVLDEFKDNLILFDELVEAFSATIEEFKTKTQVIENRSQEAAKGRDKLQVAKQEATDEITTRIGSRRLPEEMTHFLLKPWTDRLTFILLRERDGKESAEWKAAINVADALIWAIGPKNSEHDRNRLKQVLPKLRISVEEGLSVMGGYSQIHTGVLFETIQAQQDHSKRIAAKKTGNAVRGAADEGKPDAVVDSREPPPGISRRSRAKPQLTAEEQSVVDRLKKTEYGTWFELNADDRQKRVRAKLSWFSPITGNCMFVDNMGVQCSVIAIEDLAKSVHSGEAHILMYHKVAFVDQALKTIRNILVGMTKQTA